MKKFVSILAIAIAFIFSATSANAQTPAAQSITVTPMVGMNISNIQGDYDQTMDNKAGLSIGAEALYMCNDNLGISAGAIYSQQGFKVDNTTFGIDYVNVPVMVNGYVASGLALKAGVQAGFKVSDKASAHGISVDLETASKLVGGDATVKSFDLSIPVGISYEYKKVVLDARVNCGLVSIFKDKNLSARNTSVQFTLGYRF